MSEGQWRGNDDPHPGPPPKSSLFGDPEQGYIKGHFEGEPITFDTVTELKSDNDKDRLAFAYGLIWGMMLATVFWGVFATLLWLILR